MIIRKMLRKLHRQMMKNNTLVSINGIEKLEKGKYRIGFDTGVVCLVYGHEIRDLKLESGMYITEKQYQHILNDIVGKRARKRALYLLEKKDRTEQQLREKQIFTEYPEYCIDEAVAYVKRYHYLDDSRYAEAYTRYSKEKFSRQMVKQKLMVKGVSKDIIDRVVENTYDADESEHIRRLLEKKHYDSKSCDEGEFRRIYQYLLRRGFYSYDILKEMKQYQELPC